jgi:hypothetical protein
VSVVKATLNQIGLFAHNVLTSALAVTPKPKIVLVVLFRMKEKTLIANVHAKKDFMMMENLYVANAATSV